MAFPPGFSTSCARGCRWPTWSAGASGSPAAGASMAGSARSTTRRRRPSTSSRTRASFTASAAARMATRSASSCAPTISTFSRRSSDWRARPGSRCRSRPRRSARRRSAKRRCSKRSKPPPHFYEARLWSPAGARGARLSRGARARRRDDPRAFGSAGRGDDRQALRRALAAEFPEPLLRRGRAAASLRGRRRALTIISAAG